MIRVAATADVHYGPGSGATLRDHVRRLGREADVLLIAGDLTQHGLPDEASGLADDLRRLEIPVAAVLGNHDHHSDLESEVRDILTAAGVTVLEAGAACLQTRGGRLGVAGLKGFGGGFAGACVTEFGERETKAFAQASTAAGRDLGRALEQLPGDGLAARVALLHYAPIEATLVGEPEPLWPFLGNYLLAEAIDRVGADVAFHGHAHAGSPSGRTPKGTPVWNVAQPVTGRPYVVFEVGDGAVGSN